MSNPTHLYAFVQRTAGQPYGLSLDPSKKDKVWYLLQEEECKIENHREIESAIPNKEKFTKDTHIRTVPLQLDAKIRKKYLSDEGDLQFNDRVLSPDSGEQYNGREFNRVRA